MSLQALWIGVVLAVALVAQTVVGHLLGNQRVVDLVTVAVIYYSLGAGPVGGLVIGSLAGLAQDAVAGGIVGVGGFAGCLVGYAAGAFGAHFIVTGALPRFVVFVVGSLVQAACVAGLYALIDPSGFDVPDPALVARALFNGVVGVLAFHAVERLPQVIERRRVRRAHLRHRVTS